MLKLTKQNENLLENPKKNFFLKQKKLVLGFSKKTEELKSKNKTFAVCVNEIRRRKIERHPGMSCKCRIDPGQTKVVVNK